MSAVAIGSSDLPGSSLASKFQFQLVKTNGWYFSFQEKSFDLAEGHPGIKLFTSGPGCPEWGPGVREVSPRLPLWPTVGLYQGPH